MREVNYEALREAAEKATKGCYIVGHTSGNQHGNITGVFVCQKWKGEPGGVIAECHVNCLIESDAQAYANAEFIAEANPATVLELLDELEAQSKRIAELETNLAALAAENAGLNKFIVQSCYVFDGEQDELSDAYICAIDGRMPQIPATDAFLADVRAGAFNDLCAAFVRHAKIAGLGDGDTVTLKEATDALLHCAEQLRAPEGLVILAECPQ
ncbi:ead/Ea22-like family protein [Escherichia coli]|nr:ead/Ea22-like family protein [Escherichia coli]EER0372183.1 ead/Ea22-like family protein [Escherichia coli]EER4155155.1 ead/Ea22-like family protein [Escherichia coli]EER8217596.1 ead/Ea22-like family protein [Escherichia coli]EES3891409.1 ead/Ea22-like family protein [Escherichia coli]EES5949403.1 ead/Ea22-like family protein [Escherichia coli]